jgi:hypothetical protein
MIIAVTTPIKSIIRFISNISFNGFPFELRLYSLQEN